MKSDDYKEGEEHAFREIANYCLERLYVEELPNKRVRLELSNAKAIALDICKMLGFKADEFDSLADLLRMLNREVFEVLASDEWKTTYEKRPSRKKTKT